MNLCKTCKNQNGIVFNATWNPLTGEVATNPKYVCKFSHLVEEKTECENYESEVEQ
jgi:hypothetical protein